MSTNKFYVPKEYKSLLSIKETEVGIKLIKDYFERQLAVALNLTRVSAPLFVQTKTGVNDNLNGLEKPVAFTMKSMPEENIEIVHSLAKWKRMALKRYGFNHDEGLYTDMNAIRKDEELDNLHSIYVDQWDWERIINFEERNIETLKVTVNKIYQVLKDTERFVYNIYPQYKPYLPENITYISSQELEDLYPNSTPKERETLIAKKHGAVFIIGIGDKLNSGFKHDDRSPDYDDWKLNGDIIFYYPVLDQAFEISSMGIRVDEETLKKQLSCTNCLDRLHLDFHQALLNNELPYTLGGGIGQSRLCMFFLRKAHIGEVQSSIWDEHTHQTCSKYKINLL